MKDRALIAAGAVGVVLAAICCAAPLLAVTLATAGLTACLANGAYVLIPALLVCLGLIAYRLNRRRTTTDCGTSTPNDQEIKSS
ncbi:MAG: mercury transport protein [Beijerinckiaceae bacterium]|jgi:mercuric ion transport protein|nr:MAG: mercury transport protein [Beijerinckiaceae bacterium]